jgi:hypothetical protein
LPGGQLRGRRAGRRLLTLILVVASGIGPTLVQRIGLRCVLSGGSLLWSVVAPSVVVGLGFAIMVWTAESQ